MATAVGVRVSSLAPRRSKVRFAPTSFYACGTKRRRVIRPLPGSSSPTATHCAGLAVGSALRAALFPSWKDRFSLPLPRRGKVRFAPTSFYACGTKRRHPPAPWLLLSNRDPLRWARGWIRPTGGSFSFLERFAPASFFPGTKTTFACAPTLRAKATTIGFPAKTVPATQAAYWRRYSSWQSNGSFSTCSRLYSSASRQPIAW